MLETKSKNIGDHAYSVTQLGAKKGRQVLTRLVRLAGPALAGMSDANVDLGAALGKLVSGLSEEDTDYLCDTFAPSTTVDLGNGKTLPLSQIFDVHFAGKYLDLVLWLKFSLEVNFGSFFAEVGRAVVSAAPSPASGSNSVSVTQSTGPSGA